MSGATRVRSMNGSEPALRPVLVPGGNKARMVATSRKPSSKPLRKIEKSAMEAVKEEEGEGEEEKDSSAAAKSLLSPPTSSSLGTSSASRRRELLLRSNMSLNTSCSSDASTDSFCSRASTGRIGRPTFSRRQRINPRPEQLVMKLERVVMNSIPMPASEVSDGKLRCPWVTSHTDPSYVAFHDEEWGVPVHDDKKLFELLVLSSALAELTWPAILSKRHIFREVFMDFDPLLISKFNEKKFVALGSTASSLLSEPRLRSVIENAHQTLKIVEEFGSFDRYCWSFVNYKPILSRFRYPRQVPVKTPKADAISKDLMKRGFRSVSPTVIYSFMQVSGMTNDHLISCYRFEECIALLADANRTKLTKADTKMEPEIRIEGRGGIDLELPETLDRLKKL